MIPSSRDVISQNTASRIPFFTYEGVNGSRSSLRAFFTVRFVSFTSRSPRLVASRRASRPAVRSTPYRAAAWAWLWRFLSACRRWAMADDRRERFSGSLSRVGLLAAARVASGAAFSCPGPLRFPPRRRRRASGGAVRSPARATGSPRTSCAPSSTRFGLGAPLAAVSGVSDGPGVLLVLSFAEGTPHHRRDGSAQRRGLRRRCRARGSTGA